MVNVRFNMNKHEADVKIEVLKTIDKEQCRLHDLLRDANFMSMTNSGGYRTVIDNLIQIDEHMITMSKKYAEME